MLNSNTAVQKMDFSFCTIGLSIRDELLFKSYVNILSHRTRHHWSFRDKRANLCVVAADCAGSLPMGDEFSESKFLTLGAVDGCGESSLPLPLRPTDIEEALNRMGDAISMAAKYTIGKFQTSSESANAYKLRRWPDHSLMKTHDRRRLAAILISTSCSLDKLQSISGQNLDACLSFINDLVHAGMLDTSIVKKPHSHTQANPLDGKNGFFFRIRQRLQMLLQT